MYFKCPFAITVRQLVDFSCTIHVIILRSLMYKRFMVWFLWLRFVIIENAYEGNLHPILLIVKRIM